MSATNEAARWRSAHPDAATREHWGFLLGLNDHAHGVARDDVPFFIDSDAGRCWLSGWDVAEREEIRESHREKNEGWHEQRQQGVHEFPAR